jgi:hypothetical protein
MVRKGDYIFSHFYNFGIGLTKLSVLALYYRIFETPRFRRVVVGTAVFVTAWILVMELLMGFACRPVAAWWGGAEGTCVSKGKLTLFTNITNISADLWIFALPIPKIAALQAMRDKRLSLFFLFSVGLGTCVLSAVRLSVIPRIGVYDFTCKLPKCPGPSRLSPRTGAEMDKQGIWFHSP